jgi:hypothetical protein
MSVDAFEIEVNRIYDTGSAPLVDGYAPFCKHVFVANFAGEWACRAKTDGNK